MTAIDTKSDVEVFEQLTFEPETPCSFPGCPNTAAWLLLCPYDRNPEECCQPHRIWILEWPEDSVITFNRTCGHNPDVQSCLWEPIK